MKSKIFIISLLGFLLITTICLVTFSNHEQALLTESDSYLSSKGDMNLKTINYTCNNKNLPIYHVSGRDKQIAISFDAAWGADDFPKIMEILDKHKVKATYFVTGDWVEKFPDAIKTLAEQGHDIGNHSEHHFDMTKLSGNKVEEELKEVEDRVYELTGYEMYLFRAPYGAYNNALIKQVYELGYYPIQWDVDSLDWKDYGVERLMSRVCNHANLSDGSILLFHNGATYTADALDQLLTKLEGMGYEIVPVSQLIYRGDYYMDIRGWQVPVE